MAAFTTELMRWSDQPGSWVFVALPEAEAPEVSGAFGRSPVRATVDGKTWDTSAWKDRRHGWLLAVPKRIRRGKDHGDRVTVEVEPRGGVGSIDKGDTAGQ